MRDNTTVTAGVKFDKAIAITGAMAPIGVSLGSAGFESIIILTSLIWIFRACIIKDMDIKRLIRHPLIVPAAGIFLSILISVLINGGGSKGTLHDIATIRHLLYLVALLETSGRFPVGKYLFYGLVVGIVYAMANIACAHLLGQDFLGKPIARYTSKLKEGNRYPTLLVFMSLYFLSWGILGNHSTRLKKYIILGTGITGALFLSLFMIKTLILSFTAGVFFILCFKCLKEYTKRTVMALSLIAGIGAVILAQPETIQYIYSKINLSSFYARIFIWKVAFQMWLEHPLTGVGISSFKDVYSITAQSGAVKPFISPQGTIISGPISQYHAHNLILQVLSCTGVTGLFTTLLFSLNTIKLCFRNLTGYRLGLTPWPLTYFIISLAGFSIYTGWYSAMSIYMAVFCGCCWNKNDR
ncbi:MAG: O-antigen ligase family protein [Deltaproteobacteria bacterium]|nr:O-antigen ligase family protein [Deltaproteobacteria bacterium]